jgi:hypothetical protein
MFSGPQDAIRNLCFRLRNKMMGNEDPKDYQISSKKSANLMNIKKFVTEN